MKRIKIGNFQLTQSARSCQNVEKDNPELVKAIEDQLNLANGRAKEHTFVDATHILNWLREAIKKVAFVNKKNLEKCIICVTSGTDLPRAYKYQPIRTFVTVEFKNSNWYIIDIKSGKANGNPRTEIILDAAKKDDILMNFIHKSGLNFK